MKKKRITQAVVAFMFSICTTAHAVPFDNLKTVSQVTDEPFSYFVMSDDCNPPQLQAVIRHEHGLISAYVFDTKNNLFYSLKGNFALGVIPRYKPSSKAQKDFLNNNQGEKEIFSSGEELFAKLERDLKADFKNKTGFINPVLSHVYQFASVEEKTARQQKQKKKAERLEKLSRWMVEWGVRP